MNKNSTIYIAGHTGLLGSALIRQMRRNGFSNFLCRTHQELELTDQKQVNDFFAIERPEYVVLAAGLTGGIYANRIYPARFMQVNLAIQNHVFEAAQRSGVKKLVFFGSSCMYPKNTSQPISEDSLLMSKIEPTSEAYALAKITGIIACRSYNLQHQTDRFIALVPNSLYGPGDCFEEQRSHVISSLIRRFHEAVENGSDNVILWGSGIPRREFLFVEDAAAAVIFALQNAGKLQNTHYNLGSGRDHSIKELANIIAGLAGYQGTISWDPSQPDGAMQKLLDSSKFRSLGWEPRFTLESGLELTYKWYKNMVKGGSKK